MWSHSSGSPWLAETDYVGRPKLRLFCLPYAGGGAAIYRGWSREFPSTIDVRAVRLPGREQRAAEPAWTNLEQVAAALARALLPLLDQPFAFFGHSMGGAIAYEVARVLARDHGRMASGFMASACRAPQLPSSRPWLHPLPDRKLLDELRRLGGTAPSVLDNAELMQLVLPTLRADLQLIETYVAARPSSLDCPIVAFSGLRDFEVGRDDIAAWRQVGNGDFRLHVVEGDHFFINSERERLISLAATEAERWTA
ncbi:thioesterase II family protein [Bradyrhizobium sp. HKCCYLRH3095]|uniref:thioesterase II family protein n=1 Tax=Bradyrhizobium sp. HKCCYLRH3095 TaxID=3420765 RepID=UPI003EB79D08